MDPITGVVALGGITLASLVGLRLKKQDAEGFDVLPGKVSDGYGPSVNESQSRYNMLTNMVSPLINGLIPVGSSSSEIEKTRNLVRKALGNTDAQFSNGDNKYTLNLKGLDNKYRPRADGNDSVFAAINFCKTQGATTNPFTTYNNDGSVKTAGAVSADGNFVFDEICGVCLSSGIDEEGKTFKGRRGLIIDPNTRDQAIADARQKGLPYPRAAPSLATCEGAPDKPVFATNAMDLDRFTKRLACIAERQIDPAHECGLCFQNDTYAYVKSDPEISSIYVVVQGVGNADIMVKKQKIKTVMLDASKPQRIELVGGKEADIFNVNVTLPDNAAANTVPTVFGYIEALTPNGGAFQMPLNLVVLLDEVTGSTPRKSGGFYTYEDINLDVAKIRPASGQQKMSLRGTIPFTFVSPDEFSAMDCPAAPYQTNPGSVGDFATDQPCFAPGSGPGKYNDDCLRGRILDVGCTNAGTLYQNPSSLNTLNGKSQHISQIYATLTDIASNDMIDPAKTKMCSGRNIETPCDPFIAHPELKFSGSDLGNKCISFLYNNKGANEAGPVKRVGPTYTAAITYANNQKVQKNLFCLPEGTLNPDTNGDSQAKLASFADNGYNGLTGIAAIKGYLNDQLEIAIDITRNANTDPERKEAIKRCFGRSLKALPAAVKSSPAVTNIPCGVLGRYVRVLPSLASDNNWIQIAQLVVIDKNGVNVSKGKNTSASPSWYNDAPASRAVDGTMSARPYNQMYHSWQNLDPSAGPNATNVYWMVDLGATTDITKIIYYNRTDCCNSRAQGMRVQILDEQMNIQGEQNLPSQDMKQELLFLNPGVDSNTCLSAIKPPPVPKIPEGHKPGLFVRFYRVDSPNPGFEVGSAGWGPRIGTANAYMQINFNDATLAQPDHCFVVAKGYFISNGNETLQLATSSDDGILVYFNNQVVINNWSIHAPQVNYSQDIVITSPGVYPFEIRFYEWEGGAQCWLGWMVNRDSSNWNTDLSQRFVYNVSQVQSEEQAYQDAQNRAAAEAKAKEAAAAAEAASLGNYTPYLGRDAAGLDTRCWVTNSMADAKNACDADPKCAAFIVAKDYNNNIGVACTKYAINQVGLNTPYQPTQAWKTVDTFVKKAPAVSGNYVDKGCWGDSWARALSGPPQNYGFTPDTCYNYAKANGADQFALQDGGWCVINRAGDNYKKYGPTNGNCPTLGGGWQNHVYQIKKSGYMYGPWIGSTTPIQQVDIDNRGNTVWIGYEQPYTKMVNSQGAAKYYVGDMSQYNSARWDSYADAGNNYRVRFD
jgi:hypothetical protein